MKNNVFLKSTLRQPLRTVFFLLLIGFITFAFTARLIEYVAIEREIRNLSRFYRSIGVLQPIDLGNPNVAAGVRLISQSPFLYFDDIIGRSAVVMPYIFNTDLDGYRSVCPVYWEGRWLWQPELYAEGLHMSDVYFTGVFQRIDRTGVLRFHIDYMTVVARGYQPVAHIRVDGVIAGYPDYIREGVTAHMYFDPYHEYFDPYGEFDVEDVLGMLESGQRYLFRARYDPLVRHEWDNIDMWHRVLTFTTLIDDDLLFLPLEPYEEVDFENPVLAGLRERLEVDDENRRSLVLNFTRDMQTLPGFWPESSFIAREGRLLTLDDYYNANEFIVLHYSFARLRGFSVGDTFTLTFRDLEAFDSPFIHLIREGHDLNWRDYPTYTRDFEIVGFFDTVFATRDTSHNINAYIPASVMPQGFGTRPDHSADFIHSSNYVFVLNTPREQGAFIDEYGDRLAQMGINILFMETGAMGFFEAADPIARNALLNVIVFGIMLMVTLALVVFLYLFGRRKDAAILRALGLPKAKSTIRIITPILYIGIIGIIVGGIISWQIAMSQAYENMAGVVRPEGVELLGALQPGFGVVMCAGVLVMLMLFTYIGAAITLRKPVLEQLQGAAKK